VSITIATWNLENLFLPGTDAGPPDQATYDAKLASLAAMIAQIAPDVLAVQEVGDDQAFADLRAALDGEWHAELSPTPTIAASASASSAALRSTTSSASARSRTGLIPCGSRTTG
jgi:endonuclease/exonuclease/phosphatase family protein